MTREEINKLIMQACERTWNERTCKEIRQALEPCEDNKDMYEPLLPIGKYPKTSFPCDVEEEVYKRFVEPHVKVKEQQPCEDAVSREAVYRLVDYIIDNLCENSIDLGALESWGREQVMKLPSVTQKSGCDKCAMNGSGNKYCDNCKYKRQTWEWIDDEFGSKCSCCGIHTHLDKFDRPMKFKCCSMCGAKMVKSQESEEV